MSNTPKVVSPLDIYKSRGGVVSKQRQHAAQLKSLKVKNVKAGDVDEITLSLGTAGPGDSPVRSDGYYKVIHLSSVDVANGASLYNDIIPAGSFSDESIVEIEITGKLLNRTGGTAGILIGMDLDTVGITDTTGLSVSGSNVYRMWTYRARITQAASLGNSVQCDEWMEIESPATPGTSQVLARTTTTDLSSGIDDEMTLGISAEYSTAVSSGNIWKTHNTLTIKIIDGASGYSKSFWTQPVSGTDTYINSSTPNTNRSTSAVLSVGEIDGASNVTRTLVKFPHLNNIPENAEIDSATLYLCTDGDFSVNTRIFDVFRIVVDWDLATATWNARTGAANWSTAGCGDSTNDYDGTVILASFEFDAAEALNEMYPFVLTASEIQKFVDGTNPNYGFLIKARTEANDAYQFHSSRATAPAFAPLLSITYHLP